MKPMSNIFFIGCTHFGHENIIKLANRPFSNVEEMDETMIENWNKVVNDRDIVYHLGDVGKLSQEETNKLFRRLKGIKYLIIGNHDYVPQLQSHFYHWYHYTELMNKLPSKLILFHYPIEEWDSYYRGSIHLHCHTHSHEKKGNNPIKNRVNVSVEAWNYTPVSLDEVLQVW